MNDNKMLLKFSGFFKWLSIVLLVSSFFVLLLNIISEWAFPPQLNIIGVENIFIKYEPTIKIFTYFLGTFAIWLTLSRMLQTKDQITLIEENNRFNNYFKHRDQFIAQFKDNIFFKEYENLAKRSAEPDLMNFYNTFYYKSHHNFTPFMNKTSTAFIDKFINAVEKSKINIENTDLNGIAVDELIQLSNLNYADVRKYTTAMNCYLTPQMRTRMEHNGDDRNTITTKSTKFIYMNELFWSGVLYKSLKAFDGMEKFAWDYFPVNFINYREEVYYEESKAERMNTA